MRPSPIFLLVFFALWFSQTRAQSDSLSRILNHLRTPVDTSARPQAPVMNSPGKMVIHSNARIDSLERKMRDRQELHGYRIQVFMGTFAQAKSERQKFMGSHPELACHQVQNIPQYTVRVGDFRTYIEAHKVLADLKKDYPGAFVLQDIIEPPKLK